MRTSLVGTLRKKAGWLVTIPIVAAAIFYLRNFGDLFLLIEYRQFAGPPYSGLLANLRWFYEDAILHSDWRAVAFSRVTSFAGVSLFSSVCGSNSGCHDWIQIGMLLAAGAFLGALLAQQTLGRYSGLVAAAVLFFLFSAPILDAVAWQATIHDKFSVLLSAAFIWYVARIRVAPRRLVFGIFDQVILLVLTILTMNAKEAAWSIVPSVVLLAIAQHAETRSLISSIGHACARFGLSIAYLGIHVGFVMANRMLVQTGEAARVMSGSARDNLQVFTGYLLNQTTFSINGMMLVLVLFAAFVLFAVWIVPTRRNRLLLLWAAISFLAAMSIPLRTTAVTPFYLLVPLYYFAIVLFWIAAAIADALTWRPARIVGVVVLSSALAMHLVDFARGTHAYSERIEMSRNFQRSLRDVATEFARDKSAAVMFYYPPSQGAAFMFVGSTGTDRHTLAPYIAPAGTSPDDLVDMEKRIHDAPIPDDGHGVPAPNEISVYLRDDLTIAELRHNPTN